MLRIFVLYVLLVLSIVTAHAATIEDSAKAENEVVLYSSLNNEQIVTLVDAFKKKYPNIKPSFYRGTSERVLQRAVTEAKAGRFAVDVVTSAGFQVQLLKDSGLTQRFVPPEASFFNDGFKDPDGHWVSVHSLLNSMAYNTQLVKPNETPKKGSGMVRQSAAALEQREGAKFFKDAGDPAAGRARRSQHHRATSRRR